MAPPPLSGDGHRGAPALSWGGGKPPTLSIAGAMPTPQAGGVVWALDQEIGRAPKPLTRPGF